MASQHIPYTYLPVHVRTYACMYVCACVYACACVCVYACSMHDSPLLVFAFRVYRMCVPLYFVEVCKYGIVKDNWIFLSFVSSTYVSCSDLFHVYLFVLASGPFPSNDMKEWFDEGYFTLDLMVRRACDELMLPLGAFCKPVV